MVTRKGQHIRQHHKIVDKQAAKEAAKTFTKLTSTNTKRPATPKAVRSETKLKKARALAEKPSSSPPILSPAKSKKRSIPQPPRKKRFKQEKSLPVLSLTMSQKAALKLVESLTKKNSKSTHCI